MRHKFDWQESPDLNITPLVDIMLVLLAILMVTTPAVIYEEQISLPKGSKSKVMDATSKPLDIRMDKNLKIYIDSNIYDLKDFPDSFKLFSQTIDKQRAIFIRADKEIKYQNVMDVLKSVKDAGFLKVSLVTDG